MVVKSWQEDVLKEDINLQFLTKDDLNNNSINSFGRKYRLKSSNKIASLFKKGSYLRYGCVVVRFQILSLEKNNIQIGVSVPKSRFKNATTRNLLKRRMRESIRLQTPFINEKIVLKENKSVSAMFIYSKNAILDSKTINHDISQLIKQFIL